MKFNSFKFEGKEIVSEKEISSILSKNKIFWLNEAEFDSADVELTNDTIIWQNGNWYWGEWYYGIWKSGTWHDGTWQNGIWESGDFNGGKFISGIWKSGNINGGDVSITHK